MRRQDTDSMICSIARSASLLGDVWVMLILRDCFTGIGNFSALQKSLQINKSRLSERLNRLIEEGVLKKELYDESHSRYAYKLTSKGRDLYPVLLAMVRWGDKYKADDDGVPFVYVHRKCGHAMTPVIACSECGEELESRDVKLLPGEGLIKKAERGELTGTDAELLESLMQRQGVKKTGS